ncbi:MAG: class I SAM-dependent methyltransferase, partial [Treponema sp.]|nr:class I SAM-dependent methyltransferase [Treponema sp.]
MVKTWSSPAAPEETEAIPCALCGQQSFKPSLSCGSFSYVRCASCGLVQINPQPLESEIKRRYGENYLTYELENEEAFFKLQLLGLKDTDFDGLESQALAEHKKRRVLDIGCATGRLLEHLRERGWETAGVEISAPQAEYCRQKRNLDVRSVPL